MKEANICLKELEFFDRVFRGLNRLRTKEQVDLLSDYEWEAANICGHILRRLRIEITGLDPA